MWILSYDWSFELYSGYLFRPWRLLMLVFTSPGIIAALWLLRFKESPQFLVMRNQTDKAAAVVRWINKTNKGKANLSELVIEKLETDAKIDAVNHSAMNNKSS